MKTIKFALLLSLAVLFLQSGCGNSDETQSLTPVVGSSVGLRSTGGVTGYIFQVNPVFIVDLPANAPTGSQARGGALIRILDMNGKLLKEGSTGADGRFEIHGLPPGRLTIEARVDPKSANPDVTEVITLIPDTTIVLGRRFPIDRDSATSLALQGIEPRARVLATLQPKSFEEISPGKFSGRRRATSSLKTSDTYRGRLSTNNDAVVASAECLDLKASGFPETATEDTFERKGTTTAAFGQVELETTQTVRILGLDRLGLVDTKACKIRVILDSCYSGILANDLVDKAFMGTTQDLFVIGSSIELGIIDRLGCRFTQAAYIRADIVDADFTGLLGPDGKLLPVLQEFGQEVTTRDSQKSLLRTREGTGHCAPTPDTAPTPTPSPTDTPTVDLIDAAGAQGAITAFHEVGVTSCPQKVGTIAINRVVDEPVSIQLSVPTGSALFLETPTSFILNGTGVQLTTRDVFFDCSTVNSFSTLVTVTATRTSDGAQEVVEVPVTVEIQP